MLQELWRLIVTLYTIPDCPLCADVRALLKEANVSFVERNVKNDFAAMRKMFKLTRQGLVPVVECAGTALVRPANGELMDLLASMT